MDDAARSSSPSLGRRLGLGLYYLALGTWFGTTVMMGFAAATTFRTTRALEPIVPSAPATVDQPAEYLAGEIVNRAFTAMSTIHLVCAAIVVLLVVLQCTVWRRRAAGRAGGAADAVRIALLAVAVAVLAVDLAVIRPRMSALRETRYDGGVTAAARAEADASFDTYHRASERLLSGMALAVGAAVLISPVAFAGAVRRSSEASLDG